MRPVYDATSLVPFILSVEGNAISLTKARYARREINIVRDEQRLYSWQSDDKALMSVTISIVRKHLYHDTLTFYLRL